MKIRVSVAASLLGISVATVTLSTTFGLAAYMQRRPTEVVVAHTGPSRGTQSPLDVLLVERGRSLFLVNCAHCHGDDATGDEGPDLHGLVKSDARIASLINNGIKGEMPRFGAKLGAADIQAIIAFLHSLK
jgi:cytochrome c oxidase cbb3-type subunit 3